ncbi:hypothetical protein [Holophaga foetida]|uniref:hypothetical protein n=1 Tax=Holophaga foetida TaxID=35839 RepID=UPI0002471743|nr:hypothetical protein [Holophaga foetida]
MRTAPPTPHHLSHLDRAWLEEVAAEARKHWEAIRRSGSPAEKGKALTHLSACLADLEGPVPALRLSRRALRFFQQAGDPTKLAVSKGLLAIRLLEAGRPQEALHCSAQALEDHRNLEPDRRHPKLMRSLAGAFLRAGWTVEAQAWLELVLECPTFEDHGEVLEALARILPTEAALERQAQACAAYHRQDRPVSAAHAMLTLAHLELHLGHAWEAETLCKEAVELLVLHLGDVPSEARRLVQLCQAACRRRRHNSRPSLLEARPDSTGH